MRKQNPVFAIAQIPMFWELSDNVRAIKQALVVARRAGADFCAFSELALTGFHRRIVDWARPEVSEPAVLEVRRAAADVGIAAVFGAPTYFGSARLNSHLFVASDGSLVDAISKIGLTEPEATFFQRGTERPVLTLEGMRCSAVICREVEDKEDVLGQLAGTGVEVIFWPGQMRPDPAKPITDPPEHVAQAQHLARRTGAYVLQTNWPNALNRPEESENTGHSACIDPEGTLLFRLPKQGFGVAAFELGEKNFRWYPSDA